MRDDVEGWECRERPSKGSQRKDATVAGASGRSAELATAPRDGKERILARHRGEAPVEVIVSQVQSDLRNDVLSLLLPVRGRPDCVARLFDSIVATASRPDRIEVVLFLDADDRASHALDHPGLSVRRCIGRSAKMGAMTGACYAASRGDCVMLMNDDVVCRTPGWDAAVVEAINRFPDRIALVWCNDLFRGPALPCFPAFHRRAWELAGGLTPAEYNRDYIDAHLYDIFRKLKALGCNRLIYLHDVVLEHMHFEAGKAPMDATYVKPRDFADELAFIAWEEGRCIAAENLARSAKGTP